MSAILELKETPQSCMDCPLITHVPNSNTISNMPNLVFINHFCDGLDRCIGTTKNSELFYTNTRHPDCPLKITEDNLRWKNTSTKYFQLMTCPNCKSEYEKYDYNFCPSCGIKLLLPMEDKI